MENFIGIRQCRTLDRNNVIILVGENHDDNGLIVDFGELVVQIARLNTITFFIYEGEVSRASADDVITNVFDHNDSPIGMIEELKNIEFDYDLESIIRFKPVDYRYSSYLNEALFCIMYSSAFIGIDEYRKNVNALLDCFIIHALDDDFKARATGALTNLENLCRRSGNGSVRNIVRNLEKLIDLYMLIRSNTILFDFFTIYGSVIRDYYKNNTIRVDFDDEAEFIYINNKPRLITIITDELTGEKTYSMNEDEDEDKGLEHFNEFSRDFISEINKITGFLVEIPAIIELGKIITEQQDTISVLAFGGAHTPVINMFLDYINCAVININSEPAV